MDAVTRRLVRDRAGDQCEYCRSRQKDEPFFRFQVEHIIAKQHDGNDEPDNLALSCPHCNLHKGPNLAGIDPDTGVIAPLFNPRRQSWAEHFSYLAAVIVGTTPMGRATVHVLNLNMNDRMRVDLRASVARRIVQDG
jgi:hypothetical protein